MMALRFRRNSTLQMNIFAALLLVSLTVIVLTCLFFYYEGISDMRVQSHTLMNTLSKQYARTVDLFMENIEEISLSIFTDPEIQELLANHDSYSQEQILTMRNDLFALLFNVAHPRPEIVGIRLYTLDQYVYHYHVGTSLNVEMFKDESWHKAADAIPKDEYLLLPSSVNGDYGETTVSLVRNIYRIPWRDKIGSLRIDIDALDMGRLLVYSGADPIAEQMRVFIVTDSGDIVYDNYEKWTGKRIPDFQTALTAIREGDLGEIVWEGIQYWYTFEKSEYTEWNTLILLSNDFILSKQREAQWILLFAGGVAAVLASLVAYFIARQITKPLRTLIGKMNRVEKGDLSGRMDVRDTGEIGVLSRVYNNMLDSISRLIREVYESRLAENNARLSALQAQIHPHFLYNTLNIMKSISRVKGVEEVAEMAEALADLFKYTMKNWQHPVPLRDELNHVHNYMNIQKHRFGNRFELRTEVQDDLFDASILKLTVQPLVENAIIHGFRNKKSDARVDIQVSKQEGMLLVTVRDNGSGMTDEQLANIERRLAQAGMHRILEAREEHSGIGLSNIHQRIRLMFGEEYGVRVESAPDTGTAVTLSFPYRPYQPFPKADEGDNAS